LYNVKRNHKLTKSHFSLGKYKNMNIELHHGRVLSKVDLTLIKSYNNYIVGKNKLYFQQQESNQRVSALSNPPQPIKFPGLWRTKQRMHKG
jgi:hypothetical protein